MSFFTKLITNKWPKGTVSPFWVYQYVKYPKYAVENGIQGSAPVVIGIDIRGMSRKQREEYRRRIHGGEAINFRDRY